MRGFTPHMVRVLKTACFEKFLFSDYMYNLGYSFFHAGAMEHCILTLATPAVILYSQIFATFSIKHGGMTFNAHSCV